MTTQDWRLKAACYGHDPETWFPPDTHLAYGQDTERVAKAVCRTCPVAVACLAWALETRQEHGIWGGLNTGERDKILHRSDPAHADRIDNCPTCEGTRERRRGVEILRCLECEGDDDE